MHCVLFLLGPYYLCNLFGTQRYTSSCLVTAAETGSAHTSTTEWAPLIYATNLYVLFCLYIYIFICERDCDCSCAMSTEPRSNWIWLMWLSMMEQRWWDTLATHLHWRCPAICIFFCCCCCCCPSSLVILIVLLYYAAKWACFVINQVPVCGGFAISESGQWSTHTHTLGLRVAAEMNEWMNEWMLCSSVPCAHKAIPQWSLPTHTSHHKSKQEITILSSIFLFVCISVHVVSRSLALYTANQIRTNNVNIFLLSNWTW